MYTHNRRQRTFTRDIANAFLLGGKITDKDVIFRIGHLLDVRPSMLKVGDRKEYAKRGERVLRKDVVLVDDNGEVIEYYKSQREAARQNFITNAAISKAIQQNRKACGLLFRPADEYI